MTVTVETLEKLERKMTLTLAADTIENEVNQRLKRLARQVKIDGFRPGKVPMNIVAQRYGYSVHYEVMNDKVGEAFAQAANEAKLRVAGQPRISEKDGAPEGQLAFDAVFEVYPEVKLPELATLEVERVSSDVSPAAIDKTIDILRKQRRTFGLRALDAAAADGDRVQIDFEGKIDGEPFQGGKANDFQFLLGEGQMLKEFEDAVTGMKSGESKTFPLAFPADYHGREVAGKTADFLVTVKKIEASHLPELTDELAKSLGVAGGSIEALRADIEKNLSREVKARLMARNKQAALDALVAKAELDLPQSIIKAEIDRMVKDAESHAADDKKQLELVTARNQLDALIHSVQKSLKEYGDKAGEDVKKNVQEKIDALKTAKDGTDATAIKSASEALSSAMSAIGEAMQKAQQSEQKPPEGSGQTPPEGTQA